MTGRLQPFGQFEQRDRLSPALDHDFRQLIPAECVAGTVTDRLTHQNLPVAGCTHQPGSQIGFVTQHSVNPALQAAVGPGPHRSLAHSDVHAADEPEPFTKFAQLRGCADCTAGVILVGYGRPEGKVKVAALVADSQLQQ